MLHFCPQIDQVLTFGDRCAVLGANRADLADVPIDASLSHLITVYGVEDSATRRGDDFRQEPLFRVTMPVMIDFICNTREGRAVGDTLFAPGGMFEFVPTYRKTGGKAIRQPPKLRLAQSCDAI
jgi:hypothetical protein